MANYTINRKNLLLEMSVAEPVLKKEMEKVIREYYFDPAVETLKDEFEAHPVVLEIEGGVDSENLSGTLPNLRDEAGNLFSFIGFDRGTEDEVCQPIRDRLDPGHRDGPKIRCQGMDKDKLAFRFQILAPNQDAIYKNTPLPWARGLSWAQKMEQGIAGFGYFLNKQTNSDSSHSGGGFQIEHQIRGGQFRPVSFLNKLFNNFLANVTKGTSSP